MGFRDAGSGSGAVMNMAIGLAELKSFYIREILTERTDEEHSLNAAQIGDILEGEYGVHLSRQTIYSEIEKLNKAGMDIVKLDGKLSGYYVASRQF